MAISNAVLKQGDEALGSNALASPKMEQHKMINLLATCMSKRVFKFYLYGSLQKEVLTFYFSHNAIAMEFMKEYKEFRKKIIPLYKKHKMEKIILFRKMEARVENRPPPRPKEDERRPDIAKGNFVNMAKDESIKNAFEALRKNIQENQ